MMFGGLLREGSRWPAKVMKTITVPALRAFMARHGWEEKASGRPVTLYYELPTRIASDGEPLYYYVPGSSRFIDYPARVHDFIHALAHIHRTTPEAVFEELKELSAKPKPAKKARR